jgi:phosphatidylglycerophosphatase A
MNTFARSLATLGFIGYIPYAPGTFGTLAAFCLYILLQPSLQLQIVLLLVLVPAGIWSSHVAEILLKSRDSRHIIIDEFCGYLISVLFIPFSLGNAVAAFLLFRFFDILKPFPIRQIERFLSGGKGIMADDIAAALYTNAILQIWRVVF